jgi:hypothetical protein
MNDNRMTIERVDNGYLLEFPDVQYDDDAESETPTVRREVIAEDDSQWGNLEAGRVLVWRILEFFDLVGSKHDERRLQVSINDHNLTAPDPQDE